MQLCHKERTQLNACWNVCGYWYGAWIFAAVYEEILFKEFTFMACVEKR